MSRDHLIAAHGRLVTKELCGETLTTTELAQLEHIHKHFDLDDAYRQIESLKRALDAAAAENAAMRELIADAYRFLCAGKPHQTENRDEHAEFYAVVGRARAVVDGVAMPSPRAAQYQAVVEAARDWSRMLIAWNHRQADRSATARAAAESELHTAEKQLVTAIDALGGGEKGGAE